MHTQLLLLALHATHLAVMAAGDPPQPFEGKVVGVADGDTITVLVGEEQHKVRLAAIDAPERGQPGYKASKKALGDKLEMKRVRVEWQKREKWGRILGHVYLGERWINLEMLHAGHAWHYKQYDSDETMAAAELDAWNAGRGLWAQDDPIPPWEWRRGKRPAAKADP